MGLQTAEGQIGLTQGFDYAGISYASDNEGRVQILSLNFDGKKYIIVNIYNENTEQKQVILLKRCISMLETIQNIVDYERLNSPAMSLHVQANRVRGKSRDVRTRPVKST